MALTAIPFLVVNPSRSVMRKKLLNNTQDKIKSMTALDKLKIYAKLEILEQEIKRKAK